MSYLMQMTAHSCTQERRIKVQQTLILEDPCVSHLISYLLDDDFSVSGDQSSVLNYGLSLRREGKKVRKRRML